MKYLFFVYLFLFTVQFSFSQNSGVVKGKVINNKTREALPYADVLIIGTNTGSTTNEKGEFIIENAPLGYVKVRAYFTGFDSAVSGDYLVTKEKTPFIVIELSEDKTELEEVILKTKLFKKKSLESPLSAQSFGIAEIEKNVGGIRDILKVIQSLPGVALSPGGRNDVIVRGGSTSENRFYLDGIEMPVMNHFQTQGSTGGPRSILNLDLIRGFDFYSSAFPASRGNMMSSLFEFTSKNGNIEKLNTRVSIGIAEAGVTLDGPIGKKTTFIASVRQSYLKFLLKMLGTTVLPIYSDFQFKIKTNISDNDELSIIGVGAIDDTELNKTADDYKESDNNILQKQWNYTIGANYKHYGENSTQQFVLSRNEFSNKYSNDITKPLRLGPLVSYKFKTVENKFRFENLLTKGSYRANLGIGLEQANYDTKTFSREIDYKGNYFRDFSSKLDIFKYAVFGQVSKKFLQSKLGISLGFRLDGNNYNDDMKNPFHQFSPRLALTYRLSDKWATSASIGTYYQLPEYTTLAFRDNSNVLVNQKTLKYIQATHLVSGLEFRPDDNSKITLEGFYKKYQNYPFLVRKQISLANLGGDFGVVGDEETTSESTGRAYGFEIFGHKRSYKDLYGTFSYTFVRSEFKGKSNKYIPSSWDNRHLLTITAGKKLNRNWQIGTKFRLIGGRPYTPELVAPNQYDEDILDYSRLNSRRFDTYTQLDARVDKIWYWGRFSINLYLDVQNLLVSKFQSGVSVFSEPDPSDPSNFVTVEEKNSEAFVLPTIGLIVDF